MSQTLKLHLNRRILLKSRLYCSSHFQNFCSQKNGSEDGTANTMEKNQKVKKTKLMDLKRKEVTAESKEAAKKKLMSLLSEFQIDSSATRKNSLNLAQAVKRVSKKERFKDKPKTPEDELKSAVKNVADTMSAEPAEMQQELNQKLTSLNLIKSTEKMAEPVIPSEPLKDIDYSAESKNILAEEVNQNIMSSVKDVASAVQGDVPSPIRSKLTEKLFALSVEGKLPAEARKSIENLVMGMTVDKEVPVTETVQLQKQDFSSEKRKSYKRPDVLPHIDIYGPPLNIFTDKPKSDTSLSIWKKLDERNVKLMVNFAPTSAFEEMALWTEQGKHWKFPIDNEADIGPEEHVGFHEHVFLEEHLKGFPKAGPVRIFMDLVAVGLSKNPYITVERKIENIEWFRQYFQEKEHILKETGAIV